MNIKIWQQIFWAAGHKTNRTKPLPDKTPPSHFGLGGHNPPRHFYKVDKTTTIFNTVT